MNGEREEVTEEVVLVAAGRNKYCFVKFESGKDDEPRCFVWDGS